MKLSKNTIVEDRDSLNFLYAGLSCISGRGRKYLKNTVQSLITIQNHPGISVPDNIKQEIMKDYTNEPQTAADIIVSMVMDQKNN